MTAMSEMQGALIRAVIGALHNDTQVMALATGVYSTVPDGAMAPYIVMADINADNVAVHRLDYVQCRFALDVWSHAHSAAEVLDIAVHIQTAMAESVILTGNYALNALHLRDAALLPRDAGRVQRYRMVYEAHIHATS